jgi:hypothetical protein
MATQNKLQWVLQPVNQPASEPVSQPACQPASRACKWVRRPNVYTYICVRSYFGSSVAVVSDCHRLGQSIMGSEAVNIAVNLQLSLTARDIQQAFAYGRSSKHAHSGRCQSDCDNHPVATNPTIASATSGYATTCERLRASASWRPPTFTHGARHRASDAYG